MARISTRRRFLGVAASASAAAWAGGQLYAAGASFDGSRPNETIRLGLIGCGARAAEIEGSFRKLPNVKIVACCDVHSARREAMRKRLGGESIGCFHDYRKLLEDKAIDAVVVATQPHWHVLIGIHACQAQKDVYLEKPVGNWIGEGRFMIEAASRYRRICQIGTQQRSRAHYQKAVEMIRAGEIGNISEVKVYDYENWSPGRGSPADCDPPKELDWDFYLGPAPKIPYNPNAYYDYGYDWFRATGAGHQVAWGVHHFDVVRWAMGVEHPTAVSASGGKFAFPDDNREWPDTISALVEFGPGPVAKKGFVLQYTMRLGCRREQRSHGKTFFGTGGWLQLDRSRITWMHEAGKVRPGAPEQASNIAPSDDEYRHQAVFIENMRTRTQPVADIRCGHLSTNIGHLINTAYLVGRKIRWDGEKERVIDDAEANALVHRSYRAPWKLEV